MEEPLHCRCWSRRRRRRPCRRAAGWGGDNDESFSTQEEDAGVRAQRFVRIPLFAPSQRKHDDTRTRKYQANEARNERAHERALRLCALASKRAARAIRTHYDFFFKFDFPSKSIALPACPRTWSDNIVVVESSFNAPLFVICSKRARAQPTASRSGGAS